jgi:hypothetical protein
MKATTRHNTKHLATPFPNQRRRLLNTIPSKRNLPEQVWFGLVLLDFMRVPVFFGPKAQPFSQFWATPRVSRNNRSSPRPNGPTVLLTNSWAVGPKPGVAISVPLGVAQGWENGCPFGAITTMAADIVAGH